MKMRIVFPLIAFLVIFLSACDTDQPQPIEVAELIPVSFKESETTKTLVHDDAGRLVEVQYLNEYENGNSWTSVHNFYYDSQGRVKESTTDTGWKYVYTYNGGRIISTQEFINGIESDVHTFSYDAKGRLAEKMTYQDIPEEGGVIPIAKEVYTYDEKDNLILQQLYYYTSFGLEAKLLTESVFSDYDDKINSEEYFNAIGVNPHLKFRKNNPGKMIVKNGAGNIGMTVTYSYNYHQKGYATKKVMTVVMHDGQTNVHEAFYTFKE